MIKAIIIEDEIHIREFIGRKLKEYFKKDIKVVEETGSVLEGVEIINKHSPRLVFLDIQIIDGTGFEVLENTLNQNFKTIIITAYDNYAIKAVKKRVFDYILKPIDEKEFIFATQKVIKSIKDGTIKEPKLSKQNRFSSKITIKTNDYIYSISEEDILFCKSDGNYTRVHLQNDKPILVSRTMKVVEKSLSKDNFIRCHKSYIVNRAHVKHFDKKGYLVLTKNTKIPVSTRKKEETISRIF